MKCTTYKVLYISPLITTVNCVVNMTLIPILQMKKPEVQRG